MTYICADPELQPENAGTCSVCGKVLSLGDSAITFHSYGPKRGSLVVGGCCINNFASAFIQDYERWTKDGYATVFGAGEHAKPLRECLIRLGEIARRGS